MIDSVFFSLSPVSVRKNQPRTSWLHWQRLSHGLLGCKSLTAGCFGVFKVSDLLLSAVSECYNSFNPVCNWLLVWHSGADKRALGWEHLIYLFWLPAQLAAILRLFGDFSYFLLLERFWFLHVLRHFRRSRGPSRACVSPTSFTCWKGAWICLTDVIEILVHVWKVWLVRLNDFLLCLQLCYLSFEPLQIGFSY